MARDFAAFPGRSAEIGKGASSFLLCSMIFMKVFLAFVVVVVYAGAAMSLGPERRPSFTGVPALPASSLPRS